MRKERPDLEEQKAQLISNQNGFLIKTKELEDDQGHHFLIDRSRFDPNTGRLHVRRFVTRSGATTRSCGYTLRLFSAPELCGWLREAGFTDAQTFGAEGEVLRVDSGRMVTVARRS